MRRIGSRFRFYWSPFSLTGEKIQACRQNCASLTARNCVTLKKNQGWKRVIFLSFYLQHYGLQMDLGNHSDKTFWFHLRSDRNGDVHINVRVSGFSFFPLGSFRLLFLLFANRSYDNLLHYVSIRFHLREIRWQESSYVAPQQDNSINTCYKTHFSAWIWKHFCSSETTWPQCNSLLNQYPYRLSRGTLETVQCVSPSDNPGFSWRISQFYPLMHKSLIATVITNIRTEI